MQGDGWYYRQRDGTSGDHRYMGLRRRMCLFLYSIGQYFFMYLSFICVTYIFYVLILYLFDVYVNLCMLHGYHMKIAGNITHCLILHSTVACLNVLRSWSLII